MYLIPATAFMPQVRCLFALLGLRLPPTADLPNSVFCRQPFTHCRMLVALRVYLHIQRLRSLHAAVLAAGKTELAFGVSYGAYKFGKVDTRVNSFETVLHHCYLVCECMSVGVCVCVCALLCCRF